MTFLESSYLFFLYSLGVLNRPGDIFADFQAVLCSSGHHYNPEIRTAACLGREEGARKGACACVRLDMM